MYEKIIDILEGNNIKNNLDFLEVIPEDFNKFREKEGRYNKANLYFLMQEKLMDFERDKEYVKAAYIAHLISYYLHIVFTPINNFELSLKYARKSIEYDNKKIDYKEWILIFSESLTENEVFNYLQEVIKNKPDSNLAKLMSL